MPFPATRDQFHSLLDHFLFGLLLFFIKFSHSCYNFFAPVGKIFIPGGGLYVGVVFGRVRGLNSAYLFIY